MGKWSNGSLKPDNKGCFPLLPTACIVAKDVVISAASFSESFEKSMTESSTHASAKVKWKTNNFYLTLKIIVHHPCSKTIARSSNIGITSD